MVNEYDPKNPDRPRGMFSTADRKWLLGESDIENKTQAERNRRARIRERLYHTLLDFSLVSEIEPRDCERVFTRQTEESDESERLSSLQRSIINLIAFLYGELDTTPESSMSFEECLRTGVLRSHFYSESNQMVAPGAVHFEVEKPERINVESVAARLRDGKPEDLTESELRTVLRIVTEQEDNSFEELGDQLATLDQAGTLEEMLNL